MDINEFQSRIREEFRRDFSQGRNDSSSFLMWYLEKIFGLDRIEAIDCVCDNKNDKGIDGIYVDNREQEIHVFQSKVKSNDNTTFGDKVLRDFMGVKPWFENSESIKRLLESTINVELLNLIKRNDLLNIIDSYSVDFHFVCNSFKDHNAVEYEENSSDLTVWDLAVMYRHYQYIKDDPLVIHTVELEGVPSTQIFTLSNIGNVADMIVFPLNAQEILKLKGINDYTLFNKNVRYGLGNTRVNKSIRDTLKNVEEKDKFILFHNGISIVCQSFEYDNNKNTVKLTNYSVVNGAQSTLAFYKHSKYIDDNTNLLVKVTNIGSNPDLMNKITYTNNNQNSINMRDLRSNDNVQRRLENEFIELCHKYGYSYVYVPKRGKILGHNDIPIESDYAAQLITACYLKESYSTHEKAALFSGAYGNVFNRNINAKKLLVYYLAHKVIKSNIYQLNDQVIANYGLFQFFILQVLFDLIEENNESKILLDQIDSYINDPQKIESFLSALFNALVGILDHFIDEKKSSDYFDYKNFFKSKTECQNLSRNIKTMLKTSLSVQRTSFQNLCTDLESTRIDQIRAHKVVSDELKTS